METPDSFSEDSPAPELGFMPPQHRPLGDERHGDALATLVTSIALVIATLLLMAVMSSGVSHAPPGPVRAGWNAIHRG
jgi:hypothetical protein